MSLYEIHERDLDVTVTVPRQLPKKVEKVLQAALDAQAALHEARRDRDAATALTAQLRADADRVALKTVEAGELPDAAALLASAREADARIEEAALIVTARTEAFRAQAQRIAPTLEAHREAIEAQAFADIERAVMTLATARKSVEGAFALLEGAQGVLGMFARMESNGGHLIPVLAPMAGTKAAFHASEAVEVLGMAVGRAQIEAAGMRRG